MEYESLPDRIAVATYEYYSDRWNYTLSHTFPGKTKEEAFLILNAHRTTDSFLDASMSKKIDEDTYEGTLKYKGSILVLRSKIYYL